jgi:alpha-tubulin suppressor-like RCC1 family protein
VVAGNSHTCALSPTGTVTCWGDNDFGQLGDGTTTDRLTPTPVTGLPTGIRAIAAGDNQTCALTPTGTVKCWGSNLNGQLGDGTNTNRSTPVDVTGITSATALGAGDNHTCAAVPGGVRCWGWGSSGQLGHDAITSANTPVEVQGLGGTTATSIVGGYAHTCATLTTGGMSCWGRNSSGQLGIGNLTNSRVAVTPNGLGTGITTIAAGGTHTCAALTDGTIRCFGFNNSGQLGDGTRTNRTTPVTVTGLTNPTALAGTGSATCATTTTGTVRCWGTNQYGELGIGDPLVPFLTTPSPVTGLSGQTGLTAGVQHVCARNAAGTIRCWGQNDFGQLGNATTTTAFAPVTVIGT